MGAAEKGYIEIVRILLSAGAEWDKVDQWGFIALSRAVFFCHIVITTR